MAEWHEQLPEDMRDNASLADFKDVGGLAKSYIDTKSKVGGMVAIPDGRSSGEAWNSLWGKLGRPESAAEYELELPEVEGHQYDEEAVGAFKASAHALGLTPTQAQGILNHQMASVAEQSGDMEATDAADIERTAAELRTEWGLTYEAQTGAVNRAITGFFAEEDHAGLNALVASNSTLAKAFAKIGGMISENSVGGDGGGGGMAGVSVEDAKAKLAEIRSGGKDSAYFDLQHPEHQQAVLDAAKLYEVIHGTEAA